MDLNHELTKQGAVFLHAASTTMIYRLYVLPGDPPEEHHLGRIADGEGAQIALQFWAWSRPGSGSSSRASLNRSAQARCAIGMASGGPIFFAKRRRRPAQST